MKDRCSSLHLPKTEMGIFFSFTSVVHKQKGGKLGVFVSTVFDEYIIL